MYFLQLSLYLLFIIELTKNIYLVLQAKGSDGKLEIHEGFDIEHTVEILDKRDVLTRTRVKKHHK